MANTKTAATSQYGPQTMAAVDTSEDSPERFVSTLEGLFAFSGTVDGLPTKASKPKALYLCRWIRTRVSNPKTGWAGLIPKGGEPRHDVLCGTIRGM
eukprot:scaffold624_cov150-Cylindrotheca_fusiformis.AAC.3